MAKWAAHCSTLSFSIIVAILVPRISFRKIITSLGDCKYTIKSCCASSYSTPKAPTGIRLFCTNSSLAWRNLVANFLASGRSIGSPIKLLELSLSVCSTLAGASSNKEKSGSGLNKYESLGISIVIWWTKRPIASASSVERWTSLEIANKYASGSPANLLSVCANISAPYKPLAVKAFCKFSRISTIEVPAVSR